MAPGAEASLRWVDGLSRNAFLTEASMTQLEAFSDQVGHGDGHGDLEAILF